MHIVETLFPELQPQYLTRVYFGLGDNGQVKIGITKRASGRRGGEMHFEELCAVPGDKKIEDQYHELYADERIGTTEWFWLSDRLLLDLIVMCVQQGRTQSADTLSGIALDRMQQRSAA